MRRLDRRQDIAFHDIGPSGISDSGISDSDVRRSDSGCPMDRSALLARFHARETNGPMLSGAGAFAAMWRAIPLLRPFGLIARNAWVLRALELTYRGFLRIRPFLIRRMLRG